MIGDWSVPGDDIKKSQNVADSRILPALRVDQWLPEWQKVSFSAKAHRRQPEPYFYLFKLRASWLKSLSGISRRTTQGGLLRSKDLGIQRRHDENRSTEIREFIQYGYPWSELSKTKRQSGEFDDLRKPGWLPTAIVVNILKSDDERRGIKVAAKDLVGVADSNRQAVAIRLPEKFSGSTWKPNSLHPIEVIDGQHRLWAFEGDSFDEQFELPVVAFHGLDISWQAYLFWTINIKPKRINASLAFDLYPLLRTEDWLEKIDGHPVYRETRAQELTEALWAIEESPWYQRINMLGESGLKQPMVSQAAWIRSLMATFVKKSKGGGVSVGGLFGDSLGKDEDVLPWSRAQQAAFLILMGSLVRDAVKNCREDWAKELRKAPGQGAKEEEKNPAFYGPYTLLATDQGIRGLLYVTNDLSYVRAKILDLTDWESEVGAGASDLDAVNRAFKSLKKQKATAFLEQLAGCLATYDWRTSSAPALTEDERVRKAALRGSGGYKELRVSLLKHLSKCEKEVGKAAKEVISNLHYD
jgi:hypothetical protein